MKEKGLWGKLKDAVTPYAFTDDALVQHEKKSLLNPSSYREWLWTDNGATEHHFTWGSAKSSLKAYTQCPPVAAIINRKAQAYINGKTWVLNSRAKEATSPEAMKIKALLKKPNPVQNWKQFEGQGYIFQQLYGYNVILSVKPFGFKENVDATALWNITPFCDVKMKKVTSLYAVQTLKDLVESVTFRYGGENTPLPMDDVFFIQDIIPSFNTVAFPESRLISLEMPINNIIGALESENVIINSRGPMYIVSSNESDESGNIPLTPKEKDDLHKEFKQRYGLTKRQSTAIITNANIKVSSVGFSTRELMLHEGIAENSKIICDELNYPAHLMGLIDPTFNNQNAAEKGLYQNSIIPDAENNYEQWENFFGLESRNLTLTKDFSHVAVLQEDKKEAATARKVRNEALQIEFKLNLITVNRFLELNDEDTIGPEGDVYWSEWKKKWGITDPATRQTTNENNSDGDNGNEQDSSGSQTEG